MGTVAEFLSGMKVLEEINSPINGRMSVIKTVGYGTYIQVGGLTQSGGVVKSVWKSTLKKVKSKKPKVKSSLILGLGGGSAAELIRKNWADAKITGVEIDPIFIALGQKYLGLGEDVEAICEDAKKFVKKAITQKKKYDLVLVDMYIGDTVPSEFETDKFVKQIKKLISKDGTAVFNRLYYGEKRMKAVKFLKILEKNYSKVTAHYPEANVMYICGN